MGLSVKQIEKAKWTGKTPKSKCILWHDDPIGLGLRIFPSGVKTWVISYRNALGQKRLHTLEAYGVYTLDKAETEAKVKLADLASKGVDPIEKQKQTRAASKTALVEELLPAYIDASGMARAGEIKSQAALHTYPTFGKRPWLTLKRSEIRAWHDKKKETDSAYIANRAFAYLRAAIYWQLRQMDDAANAEGNGAPATQRNTMDMRNPCAGIKLHAEKVRKVRIEADEWKRVDKALDEETESEYLRAYFRMKFAVGARKSELMRLRWSMVRFGDRPAIVFEDVKSTEDDETREIPLTNYAVKILSGITPVEGNPYVFVGRRKGRHIANVSKYWIRVRKRANVAHIRPHDLRRSFGSWLGDAGFSEKQIGNVLGHKSSITSKVYMSLGEASNRRTVAAMDVLIGQAMKKQGAKKKKPAAVKFDASGKVIQMPQGRQRQKRLQQRKRA
jgi:integrase